MWRNGFCCKLLVSSLVCLPPIACLSHLNPQRCHEARRPFPPLPLILTDTLLSSLKSKSLPRVPISVGKHIASGDGQW